VLGSLGDVCWIENWGAEFVVVVGVEVEFES
jgi:hypothetical protein